MKVLSKFVMLAIALSAVATASPRTASANVFCPATIAAVENLAPVGRRTTYGVLLDFDPGDTASVRMRVDSETTRYAVDFNDIDTIGNLPLRQRRYFQMPEGEHVVSAWILSTGVAPSSRLECPITRPYEANAPQLNDPRIIAQRDADRRSVLDTFSTKTPVVKPRSFGAVEPRSCTQPYAAARALQPVQPDLPAGARAIHATGTATVRVDLDESSVVVGVEVTRSSGYAPLDRAAIAAAMKSSFKTETFACRPIASSYAFTVSFAAQ